MPIWGWRLRNTRLPDDGVIRTILFNISCRALADAWQELQRHRAKIRMRGMPQVRHANVGVLLVIVTIGFGGLLIILLGPYNTLPLYVYEGVRGLAARGGSF